MTFQFDTSGYVDGSPIYNGDRVVWTEGRTYWGDLTPFQRGYAETLVASVKIDPRGKWPGVTPVSGLEALGFSYLAPETLARIMEDCERFVACGYKPFDPDRDDFDQGRDFWAERQQNGLHAEFPPLTPYLGDDGKVYLREVGQ
jgi:hypothetical protein